MEYQQIRITIDLQLKSTSKKKLNELIQTMRVQNKEFTKIIYNDRGMNVGGSYQILKTPNGTITPMMPSVKMRLIGKRKEVPNRKDLL